MSHIPLLVDPAWVRSHPEARVVDVRWSLKGPPGRPLYEAGHIPGAIFVDLDRDLSGPGEGRHPFPSEETLGEVLSRLGIAPDTHVVVYDEGPSSVAARLWFMLRAFGHDRVSVLDGGLHQVGLAPHVVEGLVEPARRRNRKRGLGVGVEGRAAVEG